MNESHQFYVRELQPFVTVAPISRERDGLQQRSLAEVRGETSTANVTLYGSTQLAVDLAELAAEAGNETLIVDDVGSGTCTQTVTEESGEVLMMANEHSEEKQLPADAPIALDGFCLQSCSVSFVHMRYKRS